MLSFFLPLLCFASTSLAFPLADDQTNNLLIRAAVSPDATCGGSKGYTCLGSSFGNCCSKNGWCGSTAAYCGAGCQPGFGTCTSTTTTTTAPPGPTTTSTLTDCLTKKNVPIRLISSSDFSQLAKPFNLRLPYTPAVIVLPLTVQHVSDSVICAGKNKVKVQARSGGHSYASFGLGGQSGSMVIDLQNFQSITLDSNKVAKVGGGVRLGNLALGIYNQSQRALPHGTCPGVGLGGHATHGGFGYSSRTWGLTLDTIVGLDVVLANGSYIHATSTAYPDIYYALRGAAESFGIVTTFYLQTVQAPASVVQYSFGLPNLFKSAATTTAAFQHIQSFAQNASVVDRKLGLGLYLDGSSFLIRGTYFGSIADFNNKIKPELLRTLPTPSATSVQSVSWIESLTILADPQPLQQPKTGYDQHDTFYAKSLVVPSKSPLTTQGLNSYFGYMITNGTKTANPWFSIINLYGGPDSLINVPSPSSSAYSDRFALWVIQHYGNVGTAGSPFPPNIIPFVQGLSDSLTKASPGTEFLGYSNYVDPQLSAAEAHAQYYGQTTYAKLLSIKNQVDPGKVFWNPQAIGN